MNSAVEFWRGAHGGSLDAITSYPNLEWQPPTPLAVILGFRGYSGTSTYPAQYFGGGVNKYANVSLQRVGIYWLENFFAWLAIRNHLWTSQPYSAT